jgi:uncharacterized protein YeaO (DUF488 family)
MHEFDIECPDASAPDVRIKRIYDDPASDDGCRLLVDRLWPRGVTKERAALDEWLRDLAPSSELRTWFDHSAPRWSEFQARYRAELAAHAAELRQWRERAMRERLTLLYAAKDPQRNHALVLAEVIREA